jgi:pyruvate/2-oxoglutarate dehydrogenase complex dihydrolipoamide acyltransferase (E2) component
MPIEITMPRLSDTMEAGTVIKWNVKEGDAVKSGSVVADIETDKATMEMQCFDDGRMAAILVEAGKQVKVGTLIALVALEGEDIASVKANVKANVKTVVERSPRARLLQNRRRQLLRRARLPRSINQTIATAWKSFLLRAKMVRVCA